MGEGIKAFWLGVFIVVTVAVTAWLVMFLNPSVGDCGHKLKVRFADIQDISIGTRVNFGGKPVGKVVKITQVPNARNLPPNPDGDFYLYQLELCIDSSVHVYSYDEITFSVAGLLGEKSISIIPKVTPAGQPPAQDISNAILYGTSKDALQQALAQLNHVAHEFECTMHNLNLFFDENLEPFHQTVISLGRAADSLDGFVQQVNNAQLVSNLNTAANSLTRAADQISFNVIPNLSVSLDRLANGQGTLGRLLDSNCLYLQLSSTLCKLDGMLTDMRNYGLLFQWSRQWQRKRACKDRERVLMCSPQDAACLFNHQIGEIQSAMADVQAMAGASDDCLVQDDCFSQSFCDLLKRAEELTTSLKNYREFLTDQYCDCCY